jgi:hypothetical protein
MLSSVLKSRRAVQVSIAIMRAFVQIRRIPGGNRDLARQVEELERSTTRSSASSSTPSVS